MKPPKGGRLSRRKDVKLKPGRRPLGPGEHTPEANVIRTDIARHARDLATNGIWPSYSKVAKAAGLTDAVVKSHRDMLEGPRDDYENKHGEKAYRRSGAPVTIAATDGVPTVHGGMLSDGALDEAAAGVAANTTAAPADSQGSRSPDARTKIAEQRADRLMREKEEDAGAIVELKRQVRDRDEIVRRLMLPKRPPLPRYTLGDAEFS